MDPPYGSFIGIRMVKNSGHEQGLVKANDILEFFKIDKHCRTLFCIFLNIFFIRREQFLPFDLQDTNAIPAEYVLQPITYHFPHYTDLSEANEDLNRQERDQWWKIFQSFQRIFKWTARIATERRKITLQQAHKYFSSGVDASYTDISLFINNMWPPLISEDEANTAGHFIVLFVRDILR